MQIFFLGKYWEMHLYQSKVKRRKSKERQFLQKKYFFEGKNLHISKIIRIFAADYKRNMLSVRS